MFLSQSEFQGLLRKIEQLKHCMDNVFALNALIRDHFVSCSEFVQITVDATCKIYDGKYYFDPRVLMEILAVDGDVDDKERLNDLDDRMDRVLTDFCDKKWRTNVQNQVSFEEYFAFLPIWLKIFYDEDTLQELIDLGAIISLKEYKSIPEVIKQDNDISRVIRKRIEQIGKGEASH